MVLMCLFIIKMEKESKESNNNNIKTILVNSSLNRVYILKLSTQIHEVVKAVGVFQTAVVKACQSLRHSNDSHHFFFSLFSCLSIHLSISLVKSLIIIISMQRYIISDHCLRLSRWERYNW